MSQSPFKIEFKPVRSLNDVDKLLIEADHTLLNGQRSVNVIGQAHMHILQSLPNLSFRYLEHRYRHLTSDTHLLAPTVRALPDNLEARNWKTKRLTKYYVWVGLNGAAEAARAMQQFGIADAEENLTRLEKCGMLYVKKATKM